MKKIKKRLNQFFIIVIYLFSLILRFFIKKYNDVWLISERGDEARDNGYEFYKYMKKNHKEIKVKYVITKNSYDLSKINENDVVYLKSLKHYIIFLNAKYLISTHHMGYSPEFGMFGKLDDKGLVFSKGKRIFLQHGIIYNYLPSLVNKKIDLFITSSEQEKKFIINEFKYSENVVKCTGLARYDDLTDSKDLYILVMPTWRSNLYYSNLEDFKKSEYCCKWLEFLNSKKLEKLLKNNKIKILFYPHYETQSFFSKIKINNSNVIFASSNKYEIHDLLKNCKMFITDYSSTFFDIGYMRKPIIYYQFDFDEFYLNHYKKGYIDLRKNGFGKSCDNASTLINEVEKIINNNYKVDQSYLLRENMFYKYSDNNNCERIFQEIIKK